MHHTESLSQPCINSQPPGRESDALSVGQKQLMETSLFLALYPFSKMFFFIETFIHSLIELGTVL